MDEKHILDLIAALVAEEHLLRARWAGGHGLTRAEVDRLGEVDERLDQCWDLLRQRRALADAGLDPEEAALRPGWEVEAYLQ